MSDDLDALLNEALDVMDDQDRQHQEELARREAAAAQLLNEQCEKQKSGDSDEAQLLSAVTSLMDLLRKGPDAMEKDDDLSKIQGMLSNALDRMREGASDEERASIQQCQELLDKANEAAASGGSEGGADHGDAMPPQDMEAMMKLLQQLHTQESTTNSVTNDAGFAELLRRKQEQPETDASQSSQADAFADPNADDRTLQLLFEILQPNAVTESFRAMCEAFPIWFERHESSAGTEDDMQRYRNQHAKMQEVLSIVEEGPLDAALKQDATDVERDRLLRFSNALEELQKYGLPPATLHAIIEERAKTSSQTPNVVEAGLLI